MSEKKRNKGGRNPKLDPAVFRYTVRFSEEGLICNETPDDDAQAACRKLGADLAAW